MGNVDRRPFTQRDGKTKQQASIWWIKYRVQDRISRESSQTTNKQAASRLLNLREGAAAEGRPIIPRAERVTIDRHLPTELRCLLTVAMIAGWRIASNLLPMDEAICAREQRSWPEAKGPRWGH